MSGINGFVEVGEAARLLGVTRRHVARLASAGEVTYVGRGLVDVASVHAYLSQRTASRSRPWSEPTAWAAIALLAGDDVDWLGQVQTSRLRGRLRQLADTDTGAAELVGRTRMRATARTYELQDFLTEPVRAALVVVNRNSLDLARAPRGQLDGYLSTRDLERLEKGLGLLVDSRGAMVLRATDFDLEVVARFAQHEHGLLAALDAAGSLDPREQGVGLRALDHHLQVYADG